MTHFEHRLGSFSTPEWTTHETCDETTTKVRACGTAWHKPKCDSECLYHNTGNAERRRWMDLWAWTTKTIASIQMTNVCKCVKMYIYLLCCVTVNHVRHEWELSIQEGGRSQVQWNLVCHHHCDVHSWRNWLNCPTWESTERESIRTSSFFRHIHNCILKIKNNTKLFLSLGNFVSFVRMCCWSKWIATITQLQW